MAALAVTSASAALRLLAKLYSTARAGQAGLTHNKRLCAVLSTLAPLVVQAIRGCVKAVQQ